jgi:dienelactone hydrolase
MMAMMQVFMISSVMAGAPEAMSSGANDDIIVETSDPEFEPDLEPLEVLAADGTPAAVTDTEWIDIKIPADRHVQELELPAVLVRPVWSKPVGEQPAVIVLHGSGGLFKTPKPKNKFAPNPCSPKMESQFEWWAEELAHRGYTVLLPSSYSARGFCDKHDDESRIPDDFDDDSEQVLGRLYDVFAAGDYLCHKVPGVDCNRLGLVGFSQGATTTMLALHAELDHSLEFLRERLKEDKKFEKKFKLAIDKVEDLPADRPEFKVGVAFYPGCGFDEFLPYSLEEHPEYGLKNMYSPKNPLFILHAEEDGLLEHCSEEFAVGTRETQARAVAQDDADNNYHIKVYLDAGHGFDHSGGDNEEGGTEQGNALAQDDGRDQGLTRLKEILAK